MKHHETTEQQPVQKKANSNKIGSMEDILNSLVGHVVTVLNPQTYIRTITGYKIDSTTYKAKAISCKEGILRLATEYVSDPHSKEREKAQQFVPVDQIKRIMISKSLKLLTL